jgi:hypothetical protein
MKKKCNIRKIFIKRKHKFSYIRNKALNNFLLQHLIPKKIDFSKIQNCLLNRLATDEKFFEDKFSQNEVSENEGINFNENNISLFNFPEKNEATIGEYTANED